MKYNVKNDFYKGKLSLQQIIRSIYLFSLRSTVKFTVEQLLLSKKTIVRWFKLFKSVCTCEMIRHQNEKIGGVNEIVEILETHLYRRKNHTVRVFKSECVRLVCGICRSTKKVFVTIVSNRTKETLSNVIKQYVAPGSKVITDCWAGYVDVKKDFEHLTVNHKYNFINPEDASVHTQTIERFWRTSKFFCRNNTSCRYEMENIWHCLFSYNLRSESQTSFFGILISALKYYTSDQQVKKLEYYINN